MKKRSAGLPSAVVVLASTIVSSAALLLAPPANAQVPTTPPIWQVNVGNPYGGLSNCTGMPTETLFGDSCSAVGGEAMSRYEQNRAGCVPAATVVGGCTANYPSIPSGRDCPASAVSASWYWYTSTIFVNPNTGDGCNGITMNAICPDGSLALPDSTTGPYCPRSTFEDDKNLGSPGPGGPGPGGPGPGGPGPGGSDGPSGSDGPGGSDDSADSGCPNPCVGNPVTPGIGNKL